MTDLQPNLWGNLDEAVCRCPRCLDSQVLWPEWATPSSDWRPIETVKVAENRL